MQGRGKRVVGCAGYFPQSFASASVDGVCLDVGRLRSFGQSMSTVALDAAISVEAKTMVHLRYMETEQVFPSK